jgi:hypothetical protein
VGSGNLDNWWCNGKESNPNGNYARLY